MSSDDTSPGGNGNPSNRDDVERAIRQLMVDVLLIDPEQAAMVSMETSGILTSLGATSIDAFELIVSVEERFGFEFDDQELNPDLVDPLGRLVTSVCQKIGVDT